MRTREELEADHLGQFNSLPVHALPVTKPTPDFEVLLDQRELLKDIKAKLKDILDELQKA